MVFDIMRFNGRSVRESVIHTHRVAGTDLYYRAEKSSGRQAEELYAQAEEKWLMTMQVPSSSSFRSAIHICMEDLPKAR